MDLGERIREWREWRGWTQAQLADETELSKASICQYEGAGKYHSEPSQDALRRIVKAIGVDLAKFYGPIPKRKAKSA